MNIVKWILNRPLIAIWVLGAIAILLAMASGNKEHEVVAGHNAKNDDIVTTKKDAKDVKTSNHHEVGLVNTSSERKDITKGEMPNKVVHDAVSPATAMQATESHNNDSLPRNSEPFKQTVIEGTDKNSPTKKTVDSAEDLEQLQTEELLLMAREAYWNNGLDEAAQIYQQLIKREPQVIEHKGELGNVYWRQGYPKKAAELYSEIAIPLIESGSSERVTNMLGFIQLFYPGRVEVIKDRLQRSGKKATQQ